MGKRLDFGKIITALKESIKMEKEMGKEKKMVGQDIM